MKKSLVVLAAMVMVIAMASGAYAAGTVQPSISATAKIDSKCVLGGSPAIAFGTLDATMTGPYTGIVTDPTLWCTKTAGATITVGDNGGKWGVANASWNLKSAAGDLIPYTLSYSKTLTGQGKSVEIGGQAVGGLKIAGSIAAGAIDITPAGDYSDTVLLTITY